MIFLRLLPALLSLLVLGAHFLRAGHLLLVLAALALAVLLFVRRPWVPYAIQGALAAGTIEWLRTLGDLAAQRTAAGVPAGRMVVILGAVALVTALSAVLLATRAARRWYGLPGRVLPE